GHYVYNRETGKRFDLKYIGNIRQSYYVDQRAKGVTRAEYGLKQVRELM
ncbi:unnamed protein product, partial [marine sediment metagenome]